MITLINYYDLFVKDFLNNYLYAIAVQYYGTHYQLFPTFLYKFYDKTINIYNNNN